jgi:hypothetical protein
VHLAAGGAPIAQHDGQPRNGTYPTSVWQKGDIVADTHTFAVPASAAAGEYQILVGMYSLPSGDRLPTGTPGDSVQLVTVEVK